MQHRMRGIDMLNKYAMMERPIESIQWHLCPPPRKGCKSWCVRLRYIIFICILFTLSELYAFHAGYCSHLITVPIVFIGYCFRLCKCHQEIFNSKLVVHINNLKIVRVTLFDNVENVKKLSWDQSKWNALCVREMDTAVEFLLIMNNGFHHMILRLFARELCSYVFGESGTLETFAFLPKTIGKFWLTLTLKTDELRREKCYTWQCFVSA